MRLSRWIGTVALLAPLIVQSAAAGPLRDHPIARYLRWDRNGQLDERLLMQRYMAVSSFRFGRRYYGYPYSVWGGMREPVDVYYEVPPGRYFVDPYSAPGAPLARY